MRSSSTNARGARKSASRWCVGPRVRLLRIIALGCALLFASGTDAACQVVLGELIGADDRRPLPGTLITLIDSSGMRAARYVTNASGRFILHAALPGRYTIRAERIGYQVATSPMLSLGTDTLVYRFEIQPLPVQLPGIDVASRERGCERHRDGTAVATLWNEIRKALNVAEWTEQTAKLTYGSTVYRMSIDTARLFLRSEENSTFTTRSRMPFEVAAAADLARQGFSRTQRDDLYLLAPDAAVLTSAEFVDTHCFRLAVDARTPDLIGLSFEPLRRRTNIVDMTGTLWVDRVSGALRSLEFTYTNLPRPISDHGARGDMRFRQLHNGMWIVESWRIQGPVLVARQTADGRPLVRNDGLNEDGGFVTRASDFNTVLYSLPRGRSAIEGFARSSPGGPPLAGARVFLAGTGYQTVSDAHGRYRIDSLPAGRYALTFTHDVAKDVGIAVPIDSVRVTAESTLVRDVSIPEMTEVLRQVCPGERGERDLGGLIYGIARGADGLPITGAEVRADWNVLTPNGAVRSHHRTGVRTDEHGRYNLCWVAVDRTVSVTLKTGEQEIVAHVRVPLAPLPVVRADFR